jgi:hypothetical protein
MPVQDVTGQHRALQKFYEENGFAAEAAFM